MAQTKRLIFNVNGLEKSYGSYQALKIGKLEIHPGTIYGIVGTVGSGKSSLLNILAGVEKQSAGTVLYDDKPYQTNWLGKIIVHDEVFYSNNSELVASNQTVSNYVAQKFGKKKNVIENRYFNGGSFSNLWSRKIGKISQGPRILLIDDYGIFFNTNMEKEFRNQLTKMNRTLGTTLVLSSSTDVHLKNFASVLIYLDKGHISKIRPGISRKPQRNQNNRSNRNTRNRSKSKNRKRQ